MIKTLTANTVDHSSLSLVFLRLCPQEMGYCVASIHTKSAIIRAHQNCQVERSDIDDFTGETLNSQVVIYCDDWGDSQKSRPSKEG